MRALVRWIEGIGVLVTDVRCGRTQRPGRIGVTGIDAAAGDVGDHGIGILRVGGEGEKRASQSQRQETKFYHRLIFQFSSPLLVLRLRRSATGRGRLTVERPARGVKRWEVRSWKWEWVSHFNFQTSRPKENAFRPRQIGE